LFKTRVENGILGDIRFDKNGDPSKHPSPSGASYAPRAHRTGKPPTESSSVERHCFPESRLYSLADSPAKAGRIRRRRALLGGLPLSPR